MTYKLPKQTVYFITPIINFKATGLTTVMTTQANERFVLDSYSLIGVTNTAANGDSSFNLGFTAATYNDLINGGNFPSLSVDQCINADIAGGFPLVPASTILRINVTSADTGTALTGRIIIEGYLV